jgi:glycosyltransferase involved in cell wall biosynthesis
MARRFSDHGVLVDIITRDLDDGYPTYQFVERNIRVFKVKKAFWMRRWSRIFLPLRGRDTFIDLFNLSLVAYRKAKKQHYNFIIGIDTMGLIISNLAVWPRDKSNVKLAYWSLEISFMRDLREWLERLFKRLERRFARHADMIIVQDIERAALLHEENTTDGVSTKFIPNSAMGPSNWKGAKFLHRLLDIETEKRILLHAGLIGKGMRSLELAESARTLAKNYILVLHERKKRYVHDPYLEQIKSAAGNKVRLSLNPLPLEKVDRVFASAHIGVVLYSEQCGSNFSSVSFASGKLSYFLRNGVPVIVSNFPGFRSIIERYKCGVIIDELSEIANVIKIIDSDYEQYSQNAVKCFDEMFEFGKKFDAAFSSWLGFPSQEAALKGKCSQLAE